MKKMIVSTKHLMILAVMMVMTISANAMSYNAAKHEALFLSDKMAYALNLTAAQYPHLQYIAMHQLRLRITESPQLHTMTVTALIVTWL